ncbi:RNA polymerase sigma factor [Persicitalea jodogahamensis]|uniref:DNA-directed RNA polymerase sigma-70 factor n=1 Tax=Persicitalea jodogahamensis TaxID=402147 RepID=A0A8J3G8P7_9BACT|nr:sigma-70 family RNA polymerase sigma factor [Persicitalea jodogahamensis]GHB68324.1 DNA-directed RNA polymerase sigma-70 factor [Persicitalea jodogahamensis]
MEDTAEHEQFGTYLEGYKKLIVKVAGAYCSDYEDRKDLIQEIILHLWRAFPKYDGTSALSTWTYRIALNVSISYLRKETARKRREEYYQQQRDILEWSNPAMDERLEQLYRIIDQLRPLDKALIILSLEGCRNTEIADIMGISPTNVSTKLYRIKEHLKSIVTT